MSDWGKVPREVFLDRRLKPLDVRVFGILCTHANGKTGICTRRQEAIAEGRTVDPGYLDRPELPDDLVFVWSLFWALSLERYMGPSGVGPIPHSAIRDAGQRLGMDRDEAEWFEALIAAMDEAYFTHQRECREAEANVDKANVEDVEGVKRALGAKSQS